MDETPRGSLPEPAPLRRLTPRQIRRARREGREALSQPEAAIHPPAQAIAPPEEQPVAPPARPRWRRPARWALAMVSLLLVGGLLAYLIPILLAVYRVYGEVFVTPVPRPTVVINPQGTPELVLETPEPHEPTPTPLPSWDGTERINILLLGVDTTPERVAQGDPPRSDTMILVSIDPVTKQVGMLPIPRDLLVTIPGYGDDKINAAYAYGAQSEFTGPGLVRATIEYNFGIPIHYFAEVDFQGFIKIVDTLGGVTVDVPAPIKDDEHPAEGFNYTRLYFPTGLQHMDGRTALRYVRTRHDDNDLARGARQQQVLKALRQQAIQLELITRVAELIDELGGTVRTDLRPRDVLALARLGVEIEDKDIHSYSLQGALSDYWAPNGVYYLVANWPAVRQLVAEMTGAAR